MLWGRKNSKVNKDFRELTNHYKWLIKDTDEVELGKSEPEIYLSEEFLTTFPTLSNLLSKARILSLKINSKPHKLYSWTKSSGIRCGWINKFEGEKRTDLKLLDEHRLLLREIGGIWDSYNQPEPSLTNNQEFLFTESECLTGIGGWDDYYQMVCEQDNLEEINYSDFVCFVREANGDVTLYDPKSKEVFLFAHDHCFGNVQFLEGQPEYTFHKINRINSFVDYVEELAKEWLIELER